jgi:hypothetical protein
MFVVPRILYDRAPEERHVCSTEDPIRPTSGGAAQLAPVQTSRNNIRTNLDELQRSAKLPWQIRTPKS